MQEKIKMMRIALAICNIGLRDKDVQKIIDLYDKIVIKGGELTIKEIIEIELKIESDYKNIT